MILAYPGATHLLQPPPWEPLNPGELGRLKCMTDSDCVCAYDLLYYPK